MHNRTQVALQEAVTSFSVQHSITGPSLVLFSTDHDVFQKKDRQHR